jgi:hypothetical protein
VALPGGDSLTGAACSRVAGGPGNWSAVGAGSHQAHYYRTGDAAWSGGAWYTTAGAWGMRGGSWVWEWLWPHGIQTGVVPAH